MACCKPNPHQWPELPEPAPFYQLGPTTFRVEMSMHSDNRARLVARLRALGAALPADSVVLLQGAPSEERHGTDHEILFRQESFFQWAFGVKEADCFGAIDVASGKTTLFIPLLGPEYAVWLGRIKPREFFKTSYAVDEVHFTNEISQVLKAGGKNPTLLILDGLNTDSFKKTPTTNFDGMAAFTVNTTTLHPEICECRVFKSDAEIELLRYTNKISSEAHKAVMKHIKPGMTEYQLESVFRHYCYYYGGLRNMSYTCICGSGFNGAVLHYGHGSAPNDRVIEDGDMCLFDMGGEYHCYASDITCSFPANGKFTDNQKLIYTAVLKASEAVMAAAKPGVEWTAMHRLAERTQLEVLKEGGLLKGDIDEMCKAYIGALFMPHGLGHFLGLDTHDVGGYPNGTQRLAEPGIKKLRTTRKLEKGMVITIEPGVYFIESLLEAAFQDPVQSQFLVKDRILEFARFGGVRIEDDVLITETGIENLTKVPRTIEEIEATMKEEINLNA